MQASRKTQPKPQPGQADFEPRSFIEALHHVYLLGGFGNTEAVDPERVARARRGRKALFNRASEIR